MHNDLQIAVFRETTAPPLWLVVVGAIEIACGLTMIVTAAVLVRDDLPQVSLVTVITAGGILILIGVVIATSSITIIITATTVRLSYGLIWSCLVDRADIARVDSVELRPASYGGLGLRMLPGTRALFFATGQGVRITRTSDARTLSIRSDRSEAIIQLLQSN